VRLRLFQELSDGQESSVGKERHWLATEKEACNVTTRKQKDRQEKEDIELEWTERADDSFF